MSVDVFLAAFFLLTISELGDKTQLAIITLTAKSRKPAIIFVAAMIGFILINGIGVLIGQLVVIFIPYMVIRLFTGIIFIAFGVLLLLKSRKESVESDDKLEVKQQSSIFWTAFSFVSLAELGDKTQIITILLVANYQLPFILKKSLETDYLLFWQRQSGADPSLFILAINFPSKTSVLKVSPVPTRLDKEIWFEERLTKDLLFQTRIKL